uniref:DUF362 domain-containing protein n=1 Tax=Strongyloides stercoralis TaxID=6248 RepID=A0A0K0ENQ4_STRER
MVNNVAYEGLKTIMKLKMKFNLKSKGNAVSDLTLGRIAAINLQTLVPISKLDPPLTFGLLNLKLDKPVNFLEIPDMASIIPKGAKYDPLFNEVLDFQKQIHYRIGKGRVDKSESISRMMREGDYFSESKKLDLLTKLGILDAEGNCNI